MHWFVLAYGRAPTKIQKTFLTINDFASIYMITFGFCFSLWIRLQAVFNFLVEQILQLN